MSQAERRCSQKASNRPAATSARSSAADPGRRIPLVAAATRANWAWYSPSREVSLKGKPVPISAKPGSAMVETDSRRSPCHAPPPTGRRVDLPAGHLDDHAGLELAIDGRGHRHRIGRKIVQKVGGAIERVHDPDQALPHDVGRQLLADDPAGRLRREQDVRRSIRSAVRSTSVTKSRPPLERPARLGRRGAPRFGDRRRRRRPRTWPGEVSPRPTLSCCPPKNRVTCGLCHAYSRESSRPASCTSATG